MINNRIKGFLLTKSIISNLYILCIDRYLGERFKIVVGGVNYAY